MNTFNDDVFLFVPWALKIVHFISKIVCRPIFDRLHNNIYRLTPGFASDPFIQFGGQFVDKTAITKNSTT